MSEIVTLELPDALVRSARAAAERSHRRVEDVLIEWLDRAVTELPVEALPDDQVLALRDAQMSDEQQEQLRDLLTQQREGLLDSAARLRLDELMGVYRRGMVQKARALKVAVERGLQAPLG